MVYDGIDRTKNQGTPSCLSFRPPSSPWLKSRSSDRFRSEAIVRQKWYEKGAMARILRVRLDSRPNTRTASLNGTRSFLPVPSLLLLSLVSCLWRVENQSFPPTLFFSITINPSTLGFSPLLIGSFASYRYRPLILPSGSQHGYCPSRDGGGLLVDVTLCGLLLMYTLSSPTSVILT